MLHIGKKPFLNLRISKNAVVNAQKHALQEGKRFKGQTSPIKTIKKSATLIYHLVHIGLGIRIIGSDLNALSGVKIVIKDRLHEYSGAVGKSACILCPLSDVPLPQFKNHFFGTFTRITLEYLENVFPVDVFTKECIL